MLVCPTASPIHLITLYLLSIPIKHMHMVPKPSPKDVTQSLPQRQQCRNVQGGKVDRRIRLFLPFLFPKPSPPKSEKGLGLCKSPRDNSIFITHAAARDGAFLGWAHALFLVDIVMECYRMAPLHPMSHRFVVEAPTDRFSRVVLYLAIYIPGSFCCSSPHCYQARVGVKESDRH